tara:strand:+ start:817 stop:1212 length:396 start_codon:yes stop_codon:yes gene_type:complete
MYGMLNKYMELNNMENKLIKNNKGLYECHTGGGFWHAAMETKILSERGSSAEWLINEYSEQDGPDSCVPTNETALSMFALNFDDHAITTSMKGIMAKYGIEQISDDMWYFTDVFNLGYKKMLAVTKELEAK